MSIWLIPKHVFHPWFEFITFNNAMEVIIKIDVIQPDLFLLPTYAGWMGKVSPKDKSIHNQRERRGVRPNSHCKCLIDAVQVILLLLECLV